MRTDSSRPERCRLRPVRARTRWVQRAITVLLVSLALAVSSTPATAADHDAEAISMALGFLAARQVRRDFNLSFGGIRVSDRAGNWAQHFRPRGSNGIGVRDVSPFTVAFIHHALSDINPATRGLLGLPARDATVAADLRRRAFRFLLGFASRPGAADAGTFGFWPYDDRPGVPGPLLEQVMLAVFGGPILGGDRVPANLGIFPSAMSIPTDADVTATTYAAILDDALVDGGPGADVDVTRVFADWRDLGQVPRRLEQPWLPPASGAFLTWLAYRDDPGPVFPNDVDLVVNANVLYALARYDRLDGPGVAESVATIERAVALGLHRDRVHQIAEYYPDNLVFQYTVARAYAAGIRSLGPAVRILARDLEASAITDRGGNVYWNLGDPHLNTAFAALALQYAQGVSSLTARAVDWLVAAQNDNGGFDPAAFFIARTDSGPVFEFRSAAFTTAMAMQAMVRQRLLGVESGRR